LDADRLRVKKGQYMSISSDEFDAVLGEWKAWQSYPWGRLYYRIVHHNIQRHIQDRQVRILDIGGGNGKTSIHFVKQGHSVTLVDYSAAMLAEARIAAEEQGVGDRISFVQADAGEAQELFAGGAFDLVLCHLMVHFTPDPRDLLRKICTFLVPGGLLSLVDTNRYSEAYRLAFQTDDLPAARDVIGKKEYLHPWFNRNTPVFSAHEMIGWLRWKGIMQGRSIPMLQGVR